MYSIFIDAYFCFNIFDYILSGKYLCVAVFAKQLRGLSQILRFIKLHNFGNKNNIVLIKKRFYF